jgi:hypothetical protein
MEKEFELKHPKSWHVWETDSVADSAKEIIELFIQKGCKSVYNGDNDYFVYIFLT